MAGLKKKVAGIALLNSIIPLVAAFALALSLGYGWLPALMLGIVFMSSSVAVIIPILESTGLLMRPIGRLTIAAMVLQDALSLVVLSVILHFLRPATILPLPFFYLALFLILISLRWLIPRIQTLMGPHNEVEEKIFQQDVRVVFAILVGMVVIFEALGLHAVIAGFFAGFVLSESIRSELLKGKIYAISYGFFVPVFFILLGMRIDLGVFRETTAVIWVAAFVVTASLISKFISGWLAGRLAGMSNSQSSFIGAATTPQLSTSLAAALTGFQFGLIDSLLFTSIIALSVVTTFAGPFIIHFMSRRVLADPLSVNEM